MPALFSNNSVSALVESSTGSAPSFLEPLRASATPNDNPERNNLQLYLQEIGKTPLLSIEEEIALANRIMKGDKAARDHMISANLRLVVKIAMDYKDFGLPLLDLISEGNIGLIKAVERFDPTKGGKLSTYAAWWIKQSIKRSLASNSKTIRLPVHLVDKISKMRKTAQALTEELGREPTDEEIAIELQVPTSKVAHLKSVSVRPASLDAPVGQDSDSTTFGELVSDENAANPFEQLRDNTRNSALYALVESLDPREAEIIRYRFGLDGRDELTLEEVGAKFRVTRERVRQLQNLALSKMRKALERDEEQRTAEDIEQEQLLLAREEVIREFITSRAPSEVTAEPASKQRIALPPITYDKRQARPMVADPESERPAATGSKTVKSSGVSSPFAPKSVGKLGFKLYGSARS